MEQVKFPFCMRTCISLIRVLGLQEMYTSVYAFCCLIAIKNLMVSGCNQVLGGSRMMVSMLSRFFCMYLSLYLRTSAFQVLKYTLSCKLLILAFNRASFIAWSLISIPIICFALPILSRESPNDPVPQYKSRILC